MKKRRGWLNAAVILVVLGVVLAGCAALQKSEVTDVEGLLTKAGFRKQVADTPGRVAHLNALPQGKFSRHRRHGKVYYVYADATNCRCLYSGDATNYQHYQDLESQQNLGPIQMMRPDIVTGEDWSQAPWGPFN
ncbi:MAG: hypothetical protein ISS61_04225 [Desulfobacteraceae bacterium]|nr:hypothetical protein [Desulfobacteraceae bacterium]